MDAPLHVVVGGSSHIGQAVCAGLSERGRRVVCTYHDNPPPDQGSVETIRCDVTVAEECEALADKVFERDSRVFLTYMPALKVDRVLHRLSPGDWMRVMDVNLNGAFFVLSAFIRRMRPLHFGRIALVGSVSGRIGSPGTAAYSSSKEALRGLSRTAAVENASMGITVNYIELGFMNTGLSQEIPAPVREGFRASVPTGDFGDPGNLTNALLFLETSDYVTGSGIAITGGL
jgi:NAD(P)-dependent dehydrogenase (short-subunit alcohol dehydrogenase family)